MGAEERLMEIHNRLMKLDKQLHAAFPALAKRLHISDVELWLLRWVYVDNCMLTQADLCELWVYHKQTVNATVKKLEREGYIELKFREGNRKSKVICLTEKGRALCDSFVPAMQERQINIMLRMGLEDSETYLALAEKYTRINVEEFERLGAE